jgi:hypothetical protein
MKRDAGLAGLYGWRARGEGGLTSEIVQAALE